MHPDTVNSPLLLGALLLIYGSGSLLNLSILTTYARHAPSLLKTRLDRITAALIAICFVWSLGRSTIEILIATNKSTQSDRVAACFTSIVMSFIFAFNFILAMERYFSIKDINGKPFYKAVYVALALCVAALLGIFATSTAADGIRPDSKPQAMIWDAIASVGFLGASTGMVALYIATYRFTTRMFDESPRTVAYFVKQPPPPPPVAVTIVATSDSNASGTPTSSPHPRAAPRFELNRLPASTASRILDAEQLEHVRIKAEKQLLVNCIIMSAGLIVCYAPIFFYQIVHAFLGINTVNEEKTPQGGDVFYVFGCVAVALDVLLTPGLVLYFRRDVRKRVYVWGSS
ncbi:hypothetical protein CcCBS67573_g09452 [Chytriomyces confervae]|uniref:G-protein coupled receptors family 1 profile domain-containing protein n=1 Tax=Chytriomyces confervae TaxID=246404 RepID=A0A507DUY9_9FUNG|nr:hypothetical protein CcCBS67573_g09452 [Chytriomyces confervae]